MKKKVLDILAKSRRQEGFTLIEMVVVIAIIVILLLLVVPNLIGQKRKAEEKTADAFKTTLQTQVELYKDEKGKVPDKFADLEEGDYLTNDQIKKANQKFELNQGNVTKKD